MNSGSLSRRTALSLVLAAPLPLRAAPARAAGSYARHAGAVAFAAEISGRHALPLRWLQQQLALARRIEAVRKLVMPPPVGVPKNWAAYRARFIEPQRIAAGVAFWRNNQAWLHEAQERWGVPPDVVVGVIGVETFYGRIMGNFRTLDALATLSFDFPPGRKDRSAFFRSELEAFLLMCSKQGIAPESVKGSFAGAMGLPQFMPSSLNRWAVDMDGDGHVDLQRSAADAIGSVANYLASFGWQRGQPTHFEVTPPTDPTQRTLLLAPDIVPTFSAAQMSEQGALLSDAALKHEGLLALVELQNGDQPASHVAGTANFYVITRYNWSSYYAMAVIDLASAVRQAR